VYTVETPVTSPHLKHLEHGEKKEVLVSTSGRLITFPRQFDKKLNTYFFGIPGMPPGGGVPKTLSVGRFQPDWILY